MGIDNIGLILDSVDNGVIILDEHLNILFWNQWISIRTNISKEDALDNNLKTISPSINDKILKRKIKTSLHLNSATFYNAEHNKSLFQIKHTQITQSIFPYMKESITIVPYSLEKRLVCIYIYDNTRLSEQNYKLKNVKEELEQNFSIISNYVIFSKNDIEGKMTEVSDAFIKISGYSKEELLNSTHHLIKHPDTNDSLYIDILTNIKNHQGWQGEIKNKKKSGDYYWIDSTVTPEYNENKELIGYMSINTDITDKKNFSLQHDALLHSEKMASLGDMFANIAHQWRQPLSTISILSSGMIIQYENDIHQSKEDSISKLNEVVVQTEYLSETIDTFRNYIKDNKSTEKILLTDEIKTALSIVESYLRKYNIKLINDYDKGSNITISTVKNEFSQVIINIITNAIDVLVENKIEDPCVILKLLCNKDYYVISIEDNAGGIDEKNMLKIFEPYFTTKHQSKGTGLGLSICYNLVQSLNGKLSATNTKYGAKFNIKLPNNKSQDSVKGIKLSLNPL
jgi:PAS domain S-box-containing protein